MSTSVHKWSVVRKVLKSCRSKIVQYIYEIMKNMRPSGSHYNGFISTRTLEHNMYGYTLLIPMNQKSNQQEKQGS